MTGNIVTGIIDLKKAKDRFEDAIRQIGSESKGCKLLKNYIGKIEWIYKDIVTYPLFTPEVIEGIRKEWQSDSFTVDAISEKAALLSPEAREAVEALIDSILSGEELKVEVSENY